MNRIIKLNSRQGGDFSASQNLCDFDIPAGINIDMTKSYLSLNCDINDDNSSGVCVLNLNKADFARDQSHELVPAPIMVKHAHLSFENVGMVEDIRDLNVLKCNMKQYTEDEIERVCQSYKGFNGMNSGNQLNGTPFRDLVKEGTVNSTKKQHEILIDMKDIFGLGEVDMLDTGRYGQGELHITIDLDNIAIHQLFGKTDDDNNGGGYWAIIDERSAVAQADRVANGALGETRATLSTGQIAAGNVAGGVYQVTRQYDSLEESPFHNGQQLEITRTPQGGAQGTEVRTITGIAYDSATKFISLTFDAALNGGAATQLNNVSMTGVDAPAATFKVNNATLVIYENTSGMKPPDKIQYKTFTTERDTESGITSYSRNYYVEPECANLIICCPDGLGGNPSRYLSDLDISDYRLRVNGVDLTNRPIKMNTPEHYDRLGRTFLNMDIPLKSIREKVPKVLNVREDENGTASVKMIAECFPVTASAKQVEIDINSGNGLRDIFLFKEVVREI
jgi:hypothetical protein